MKHANELFRNKDEENKKKNNKKNKVSAFNLAVRVDKCIQTN